MFKKLSKMQIFVRYLPKIIYQFFWKTIQSATAIIKSNNLKKVRGYF
jgi:hypothetical protein